MDGRLVFGLEDIADFFEGGHDVPARLDPTRSRHAVAPTLELHAVLHHLQTDKGLFRDTGY